MFVIFDLDGTLALTEHRDHFLHPVGGGPRDWDSFYAACDGDTPHGPIVETLRAFWRCGHELEIWTGRSANVRVKTDQWLAHHGVPAIPIRMRPDGDHRQDVDLKLAWMEEIGRKPDLVFEDRARMVQLWRSHGVVCCQVAPGAF